jgi:hypothetical protein
MNACEPSAALLCEELTRARQAAAPTKQEIQSIISAMSCKEARESKKAGAVLIFRIRGWLLKGSALAWSAAEFHPIAEIFGQVNAYDLLDDYAKAARRRAPNEDATWRYYQLVARSKGDPERLSFAETEELFDMKEAAARRGDFHAVNRIQRFVESSGSDSTPRRRSRRSAVACDDDAGNDALSQLLEASLEDTPPTVLKRMIEKFGRRQAITLFVDRLRASPLGSLSEPSLRKLATLLVDTVINDNERAA